MKHNAFVEYLIGDQLVDLSGMSARAMFGGFGIYYEGIIVGIVVDDQLYLKVDESNKHEYELMGSAPFTYEAKDGKNVSMAYWSISPEVLEDRARLTGLVLDSYEINLKRSLETKPKKSEKKKQKKPQKKIRK